MSAPALAPARRRFWRPRAGTLVWLLLQEMRLNWRGYFQKMGKRKMPPLAALAGALVLSHIIGATFGLAWMELPDPIIKRTILSGACLMLLTGMLGSALMQMINALFLRGDFDLLLSAPLPPAAIVPLRAGAAALASMGGWLLLTTGIVDTGLYMGHPDWLLGYVAIATLALLAATAALLLALGLSRWLGAKRARIVGQTLAVLTGVLGGVAAQLPNVGRRHAQPQTLESLHALLPSPNSPLLWPGRFMQGDPWVLLPVLVVAVAGFALATTRLAPLYIATATRGLSIPRKVVRRAPATTTLRTRPLLAMLVRHEWRLIRRNPQLPLYLFQQLGSLLPMLVILFGSQRQSPVYIWAAAVPMMGFLAGALTKLVRGDMLGEFGELAPVPGKTRQWAKVLAAVLPALAVLALLCVPVSVMAGTWTAAMVGMTSLGAIATGVMFSLWVQPGMADMLLQQRRFGGKLKMGKVVGRQLLETLIGFGWAGAAALLIAHSPYGVLVAVGLIGITVIVKAPL